jgi:hypothetical protein
MKLTSEVIEGFSKLLLSKGMDDYKETPACHKEWWDAFCSDSPFVALCAPRHHGKSTALTHCYTLANCLFKQKQYVVIVSDTYEQAVLFLKDIHKELTTNEELIQLFEVEKMEKEAENDIICRLVGNHKFRITAKGAEQRMRGLKWEGKRPDMILCHEKGTKIYTPETGWIENQEYPNAREIFVEDAYKITFEDGSQEIVSADHRYLIGDKWTYPWQLKKNDNVNENINEDTLNAILREEKKALKNTKLNQRQNLQSKNGKMQTKNDIRLARLGIILKTRIESLLKLKSLLKTTPDGKRQRVLNAELKNSRQRLRGLIYQVSELCMKSQTSYPLVQDLTT